MQGETREERFEREKVIRKRQLSHRVRECSAALDLCRDLAGGMCVYVCMLCVGVGHGVWVSEGENDRWIAAAR